MPKLIIKCYASVGRDDEPTDFKPRYTQRESVSSDSVQGAVGEVYGDDCKFITEMTQGANGKWYADSEEGLLEFHLK